jgi:hypothetical protein
VGERKGRARKNRMAVRGRFLSDCLFSEFLRATGAFLSLRYLFKGVKPATLLPFEQ